jgi:hypothetical protein
MFQSSDTHTLLQSSKLGIASISMERPIRLQEQELLLPKREPSFPLTIPLLPARVPRT